MSAVRTAATQILQGYSPISSGRVDPNWPGWPIGDLGQIINDHPNFACLGAIGPDLFYFLPDFHDLVAPGGLRISTSSVLIGLLDFYKHVNDTVGIWVDRQEHFIGPISENTSELMSRLTGDLQTAIGQVQKDFSGIVTTILVNAVTQHHDWWSFFNLSLNKGYDEKAWFWSDMLHYRLQGRFAQCLWQNASIGPKPDRGLMAYALGYASHIGVDVVGHGFVNSTVGMAYRQSGQRHHAHENHMDSLWYLFDEDPSAPRLTANYRQWTESALHYDIAFAPDTMGVVARPSIPGSNLTLRERYDLKRELDIDSDLPDKVGQLLVQTIQDVYFPSNSAVPHPLILSEDQAHVGAPTVKEIQHAYYLFFSYLKYATADGFSHEIRHHPALFPNLDFPSHSDPNQNPPGMADESQFEQIIDLVLGVAEVVAWLGQVALWLASIPWGLLSDLGEYPARFVIYWVLDLPLSKMLKTVRAFLVTLGFMAPMKDEVIPSYVTVGQTATLSYQQVLADMIDPTGGLRPSPVPSGATTTFRDPDFPHLGDVNDFHHPWEYPTSPQEPAQLPTGATTVTAGPFSQGTDVRVLFLPQEADPNVRDALENADSPADTNAAAANVTPTAHLGDVVSFAKYTMWWATRSSTAINGMAIDPVDWNLDADRGYAYQAWDWNRDFSAPPPLDPEGNPFPPPCTWPPDTDPSLSSSAKAAVANWRAGTPTPLLLHYVGQGDPGCSPTPASLSRVGRRRKILRPRRRSRTGP